ncbi:MAG: hypothetical protein F7C35_08810 [Desulfurococcales archaeon]|nr:hypothetical protein [Desulfurococcales archaeon]
MVAKPRRGIAYIYMALIIATAAALAALAAIYVYSVSHVQSPRIEGEVEDRLQNLTSIRVVAHYCAARASLDNSVSSQPSLGYTYDITDQYNFYAKTSGAPRVNRLQCYNLQKTPTQETHIVSGVHIVATMDPTYINFTERFGNIYADAQFRTFWDTVVYANYSLGVADFALYIYYTGQLTLVHTSSGVQLLQVHVPIKHVESVLELDNGTQKDYPVKVEKSDRPQYDWVIKTSFVLDPTAPGHYVIRIKLYLFDGIYQEVVIDIRW